MDSHQVFKVFYDFRLSYNRASRDETAAGGNTTIITASSFARFTNKPCMIPHFKF